MNLSDCKCKEIFIICGDEDQDIGEIFVTDNWDDLDVHLKGLSPDVHSGTRVFHGVCTSAEFLPDDMYGKAAFVVCQDPDDPERGCIVEASCDTSDELASDIAQTMEYGSLHLFDGVLGIEDIFVLYGYQLETCICCDEDELDEEVIEACEMIGTQVKMTEAAVFKQDEAGG
jgi:hypothetical protein